MMNPEMLREETEKSLFSLTADASLKNRILQKAAQTARASDRKPVVHPVMALCTVVAALLLMVVALNHIHPTDPVAPGEVTVFAAGGKDESASVPFTEIDAETVSSIRFKDTGIITDSDLCSSLIRILQSDSKSAIGVSLTSSDKLIVRMADNTQYEFTVEEPYLAGEECWSCPSFFSRIHELTD